MATPGQLVAATAWVLGLPQYAVSTPWRVLREAGEVTVGGRGIHAAHVTTEDAAKLFIAVTAGSPLKSTLEAWREYSQLETPRPTRWDKLPKTTPFKTARSLPYPHRFLDALSALMFDLSHTSAREGEIHGVSRLDVMLHSPTPLARISIDWRPIPSGGRRGAPPVEAIYAGDPEEDHPGPGELLTMTTFRMTSMYNIARLVADTRPEAVERRVEPVAAG